MRKTKSVIRFLFAARTDSPTLAFYSGLVCGALLTYQVIELVATYREIREWENSELGQALKEAHDEINAIPES